MHINPPYVQDGKWCVDIVYYPESRMVETYRFDTRKEAVEFRMANDSKVQEPK